MNLDELQSIQSRERQATSLQNLRPTFYQDAGDFIQELIRERDRAAERADDPFSSDEVRRLTDDVETAKSTVEAIYERRVGKVVKTASIVAAGMPADEDGLTEEEEQLFETLVERIEQNREHVLDGVLEGGGTDLSCSRDADASVNTTTGDRDTTEPDPDLGSEPSVETTVDADADAAAELGLEPGDANAGNPSDGDDLSAAAMMGSDDSLLGLSLEDRTTETDSGQSDSETDPSVERTTVRITTDVGEVFGVDERSYELSTDDVVTLPAENAQPLMERNAAERLE